MLRAIGSLRCKQSQNFTTSRLPGMESILIYCVTDLFQSIVIVPIFNTLQFIHQSDPIQLVPLLGRPRLSPSAWLHGILRSLNSQRSSACLFPSLERFLV